METARKRFRPVAAGDLTPSAALLLAAVTGVLGFALGFWTSGALGLTLAVYLVVQVLYSAYLKHLPVVDLAVVASGFLLRAIAGGVATGIALSQWFLLVAAFGSFVRAVAAIRTRRPSSRRPRYSRKRSDGASAQCTSSTRMSCGRSSARFAMSQ